MVQQGTLTQQGSADCRTSLLPWPHAVLRSWPAPQPSSRHKGRAHELATLISAGVAHLVRAAETRRQVRPFKLARRIGHAESEVHQPPCWTARHQNRLSGSMEEEDDDYMLQAAIAMSLVRFGKSPLTAGAVTARSCAVHKHSAEAPWGVCWNVPGFLSREASEALALR